MQSMSNYRLHMLTRKRYRRMTTAGRFWTLYALLIVMAAYAIVDLIARVIG